MIRTSMSRAMAEHGHLRRRLLAALAFSLLAAAASAFMASAALGATGKIQGKVIATDTGEPIGFADVALIPADTTQRRIGGLTNADGTFLLEAPAGRYTLQVRALSYGRKTIQGVTIEAGKLLPFSTGLESEAIVQEEVVVEARVRQNTEKSLLAARKKASTVGDAVSSEQVRKSPDKDAAEVLRRVTGLSISEGKYVFVRGLGERYSSTEVDGVRLASPEQNKRVVPLDLLPANLLENIVVQKTYTADRPGEFGGGDVQVRTKEFPGARTWSFSLSQAFDEGTTFRRIRTYRATRADALGFGGDSRAIPGDLLALAADRPLVLSSDPDRGFNISTLASVARSFKNVWSPSLARALPNGSYSATYGDELKLFGRPFGFVQSLSFGRSYNQQHEAERFFSGEGETLYDYDVERSEESVQLGGMTALSYRLTPRHSLHARGMYTHDAEDEVRVYRGPDHNYIDAASGEPVVHRSTRLMYVERSVLSGVLEGRHELPAFLASKLDWKVSQSLANRDQPDRRETIYDRNSYLDGNGQLVWYWGFASTGSREFGTLDDRGLGLEGSWSVPYRLGALGAGKVAVGFSRQNKQRDNFYRRFHFYPNSQSDPLAPPESLFSDRNLDGTRNTGYVEEGTLDIDNYEAEQRVTAGYVSADLSFGRRVRGTFGVRVEHGFQDVRSFDLFDPSRITQRGQLENTDWLPSGNLTVSVTDALNLRLGASRTLSRPDLNELSPSPALEYLAGLRKSGNPDLERATIDNYDIRLEAFPTLSEVLAAGFFFKRLHEPIEQVIQDGSPPILVPRNSAYGRNLGVEIEARAGLGRLWRPLERFAVNSNASFISSRVRLEPTGTGTAEHPLQGQANFLVNAALSYTSGSGRTDVSVLVGVVGKRLDKLGLYTRPDIYEQPSTSLDATVNLTPFQGLRMKLAAKNLLDPQIRSLQDDLEISSYRTGRSYSIGLGYGS
ncbi:MAG TPA: TonB-dependent receptor [Candidatus Limnocylindria bacterium]|nr:TonB-dependent receptor [Candidatus Limnocylindria bacterium]